MFIPHFREKSQFWQLWPPDSHLTLITLDILNICYVVQNVIRR